MKPGILFELNHLDYLTIHQRISLFPSPKNGQFASKPYCSSYLDKTQSVVAIGNKFLVLEKLETKNKFDLKVLTTIENKIGWISIPKKHIETWVKTYGKTI